MRIPISSSRAVALIFVIGLGACASTSSTMSLPAHNQALPSGRASSKVQGPPGLYAVWNDSENAASVVNVYRLPDAKNRPPFCYVRLPDSRENIAGGIAIDPAGRLWVPKGGMIGGIVAEYGRRCGPSGRYQIIATLSDPDGQPTGIAFGSKGTVYVDNIIGEGECNSNFCPGNVAVYLPGKRKPSTILTLPQSTDVFGVAVDGNDDVYVTTQLSPRIFEFPKGSGPAVAVNVSGLDQGIALTFDSKQNMIVVDGFASAIDVYAPPYSGDPTTSFSLKNSSGYGFLALDERKSLLYVSNEVAGDVEVYSYPSGAYQYAITSGLAGVAGVALDPSQD